MKGKEDLVLRQTLRDNNVKSDEIKNCPAAYTLHGCRSVLPLENH